MIQRDEERHTPNKTHLSGINFNDEKVVFNLENYFLVYMAEHLYVRFCSDLIINPIQGLEGVGGQKVLPLSTSFSPL